MSFILLLRGYVMYYFIVNPSSSSGKGMKTWQTVEHLLRSEHVPYHVFFTSRKKQGEELAHMISSRHAPCTIVAVGGDGTANEVISGLTNYSQIQFGYIPSGSGNDLAAGLNLKISPSAALQAILHPKKVLPVTVGCTHTPEKTYHFIVSSGIGFDAAVCHEAVNSSFKKLLNHFGLGKLTYLGIALKQLILLHSTPVSMVLDDRRQFEFDDVFFIAAMNLKYEGGGFKFCPEADPSDDYLDLCLVEKMSKLRILRLLPTAFRGDHVKFDGVHIYRCKKAVIRAASPLAVHTDGEKAGFQRLVTMALGQEKLPFILA